MERWEGLAMVLVLILAPLAGIAAARLFPRRPRFCPSCGHVGPGRSRMRGSLALELLLYLFLIVPGLIYSLWRHSSKAPICELCGLPGVIPADSPRARAVLGHP